MKTKFNIELLIIPAFILVIVTFFIVLGTQPIKPEPAGKFIGIDAAGYKHFNDGHTEMMTITVNHNNGN